MTKSFEEELAFEAVEAGDFERAKELSLELAQQGSAYAMNLLGWMHEYGKIDEASKTEGAFWFRKAADAGVAEGFYYSGMLLLETGDRAGALEAFEQGIARDSVQAMYGLGRCLSQGTSAAEKKEGVRWLEKAAAQGHFPAKRRLLYDCGSEVSLGQDHVRAQAAEAHLSRDCIICPGP